MSKDLESQNSEQLLAEADELIRGINSIVMENMQEEHRLQFEIHVQNLKRIKSEAQGKIQKKDGSKNDSGAEGIHEAILDIVKAMGDLTKFLS
jgi:hypothetical protein